MGTALGRIQLLEMNAQIANVAIHQCRITILMMMMMGVMSS
jgi:hypothetical protein